VKQLVLLGAGHAHLQVLLALAEAPLPGARITLVSPFAEFVYSGMVPGVVAGHYATADAVIEVAALAARAGAAFTIGAAVRVDAAAGRVTLADGSELPFDALSVNTGGVMDRDAIAGAREHALFVRPIEHLVALLAPLWLPAQRDALDVAVIGGGAAGVELAMALRFRLGPGPRISLVTGGPAPLHDHSPAVRARVRRALERHAITPLEDTCCAIEPGHVLLGSGARLVCDAPLVAIGASAPPWLADSGLALDERGFISTGPTLQSRSHPQVFAVGDVASRRDAPRPRSGVYAVRSGPALATNLRRFVAGQALLPYQPQRSALSLLSCGARDAIASWRGWSAQGRWVWWWKDRIDRAFVARFR
jgi:pyridine nucleotide-disulfide oxidoreductase family protein